MKLVSDMENHINRVFSRNRNNIIINMLICDCFILTNRIQLIDPLIQNVEMNSPVKKEKKRLTQTV